MSRLIVDIENGGISSIYGDKDLEVVIIDRDFPEEPNVAKWTPNPRVPKRVEKLADTAISIWDM